MNKKLALAFFALCLSLALVSCSGGASEADKALLDESSELKQLNMPRKGDQIAVINTGMGKIKIRLFEEYAPEAVGNFVALAKSGYYDNITFHRVIESFMIQSGDPTGTGRGGESANGMPFRREMVKELHHIRGALAMAKTDENVSQRSQFYIVQNSGLSEGLAAELKSYLDNLDELITMDEDVEGAADGKTWLRRDVFQPEIINKYLEVGGAPQLDYKYTVFGQVYEGIEVVDKIAAVPTDGSDRPLEDVIVKSIKIYKY